MTSFHQQISSRIRNTNSFRLSLTKKNNPNLKNNFKTNANLEKINDKITTHQFDGWKQVLSAGQTNRI